MAPSVLWLVFTDDIYLPPHLVTLLRLPPCSSPILAAALIRSQALLFCKAIGPKETFCPTRGEVSSA